MIRKEPKVRIVISCDGCGVMHITAFRHDADGKFNFQVTNYAARWAEAQAAGWRGIKVAGKGWQHFCSEECVAAHAA